MSSESTPPVAAIILCAGKGTRMGAAARNKVCTPCAGVPVVRRILANLRAGGVSRFVVVTGHRAESVMRALDGERGVLFAYQREQLGTGDATRCGLRVLEDVGLVANSLEQARKSEGSRDRFNACVAAYEFALLLVRRAFPERQLAVFRDLARVRPFAEGYRLLRAIPRTATRDTLRALLPESGSVLTRFSPRTPTRASTTCAAWHYSVSANVRVRRARWTC